MCGEEKNYNALYICISRSIILGIFIVRNDMLTFQSQVDISFVGWIKTQPAGGAEAARLYEKKTWNPGGRRAGKVA